MRSLSVQGMQRIYHLRMEEAIPAPPLIDKMFGAGFPYWPIREPGTIWFTQRNPPLLLWLCFCQGYQKEWQRPCWMLTIDSLGVNYNEEAAYRAQNDDMGRSFHVFKVGAILAWLLHSTQRTKISHRPLHFRRTKLWRTGYSKWQNSLLTIFKLCLGCFQSI